MTHDKSEDNTSDMMLSIRSNDKRSVVSRQGLSEGVRKGFKPKEVWFNPPLKLKGV